MDTGLSAGDPEQPPWDTGTIHQGRGSGGRVWGHWALFTGGAGEGLGETGRYSPGEPEEGPRDMADHSPGERGCLFTGGAGGYSPGEQGKGPGDMAHYSPGERGERPRVRNAIQRGGWGPRDMFVNSTRRHKQRCSFSLAPRCRKLMSPRRCLGRLRTGCVTWCVTCHVTFTST